MGAIAVFTETGNTARMISKYRPKVAIYAFTHIEPVVHRMNLYWGVHPVRCRQARSAEQMVTMAEQDLVRRGLLKPGDVLGVVAGTRQASGSTNLMRLHVVTDEEADRIVHPEGAAPKEAHGNANVGTAAIGCPGRAKAADRQRQPQVIIAPYAATDTIGGRLGTGS